MLDLIPLMMTVLGVGLMLVTAVALRRSAARRPLLIAGPFVALGGSYLAYAVIDGDPDVWDFYRSVWWAPAVLAVLFALAAARRRRPRQGRGGTTST
jgi:MYXO-CTERM domain-containing protein